ncbi:MAG: hypothetical protein IKV88_09785 [Clostridia bacterium]|nr:hypothetical protein [Clostridia bacterium]
MKKLVLLILVLAFGVFSFASCSDEKSETEKKSNVQEEVDTNNVDSPNSEQQEEVKGKYSDNEVYKSEDGKEYSKTEDGKEVELSGDNFQKLMEEYEKVKGTGSEREKELLDQIQVIMDVISAQSPQ